MRVLVTGGTGFVGSHAVAALAKAGHDVRLFVRRPERIHPALAPLGVTDLDRAVGDVTDRAAVTRALRGRDAVLHAAAVYSLDVRDARRIARTNAPGARIVLETAAALGLDPIVHVSSFVALLPPNGRPLTPDSPPGRPRGAYARSKAAAERIARDLQGAGSPVVTIYPGVVLGPHDPWVGENHRLIRDILKGTVPMLPPGAGTFVDVRDVARVLAAVMRAGTGPGRYLVTGTHVPLGDLVRGLRAVTGRRMLRPLMPAAVARAMAPVSDAVQRVVPWRLPVNGDGIWVSMCRARGDDSRTRTELGVEPRPIRDTLAATVAWLAEKQVIGDREAGALAE